MDNLETPSEIETDETLDTGIIDAGTEESSQELDLDKADNLTQIREYAKGLKADVSKYKDTHKVVEEKFGGVKTLEDAYSLFSSFAGDKFDPDAFYKTLEQFSPTRSKQLFEKYASEQAVELSQKEVEKLFGGKVSPEDISLFKKFKESGYGLGIDDDIPEALKFDKDGNPKSDEEIDFLRNLHKTAKANREHDLTEAQAKQQREEEERQSAIAQSIDSFSQERIAILDKEFEPLGLSELPTDTADQRQEKAFIKQFLINGVTAAFIASEEAVNYQSAVEHLKNGESILARRYEPKIEAGLLKIMRSKPMKRLVASLVAETPEPEVTPEISKSGTSTDNETPQRENADDMFKRLVAEGKIKV